ncbi:MAG TPA: B-box zinc finger protein [Thermoanaerobaculia bacterium]|jgi:hypothetical protein
MDFPSREEARVYMMVQARGEAGADDAPAPSFASPQPARSAAPRPVAPPPAPPAPPAPARLQPSAPPPRPVAKPAPPPPPPVAKGDSYVIQKIGFEGDTFDRRGIRVLIRTGMLNPADSVTVDGGAAVRADTLADLKSLFELRKSAKFSPPAACPRHLDRVAHYLCATSRRPLCEECAEEKKFGGASVRVCVHCAGNVEEIPVPNE